MSDKIIQLNQDLIKYDLKDLVRNSVEETWNVNVTKYRRQIIYRKMKAEIGKIFRQWCERKAIEMIAVECCSDHIHMLIDIPLKYSVSEIVGCFEREKLSHYFW